MSSEASSLSSSRTSSGSSKATIRPCCKPRVSVDQETDSDYSSVYEDSETTSKKSVSVDLRSILSAQDSHLDTSKIPSDVYLILSTTIFPSQYCEFIETEDFGRFIICPAQIHINLSESVSTKWIVEAITMPIIRVLGITCVESEPCISGYDFKAEYSTSAVNYSNSRDKVIKKKHPYLPSSPPTCMKPHRGVCVDLDWTLKYLDNDSDTSSTKEEDSTKDDKSRSDVSDGELVTGWFTDVWIPLPSWLFATEQERKFKVSTEAWFCSNPGTFEGSLYMDGGEKYDKVYHEADLTAARMDYGL